MPKLINPCGFAWGPFAPDLFSVNPYRGCPSPKSPRLPPGGWREVQVAPAFEKVSFAQLEHEAIFLPASTILVGATRDPYPPLERSAQLTQAILQSLQTANLIRAAKVTVPQNHKVLVLTKSPIVCRDWELLREMGAWVGLSLTAPAGVDTRAWEPYAFSNASRIAALKFLHPKGVKTFASLEPWLLSPLAFKVNWDGLIKMGVFPRFQETQDRTQPWRIIEETHKFVDYYIVGSHNQGGRPLKELTPYYRAALPGVILALEKFKPGQWWLKPELAALRREVGNG